MSKAKEKIQPFPRNKEAPSSAYPQKRLRRLRRNQGIRDLLQEHYLSVNDLIYPIFVEENLDSPAPITSLPGVTRQTESSLTHIVKEIAHQNIKAVMLFGVSHNKDAIGNDSLRPDGLLARMISRAKDASPDTLVIADTCFCEYTDHGHCGALTPDGDVDNDRTLDNLAKQAIIAANAGADIIAPSGMTDGMVATIRQALDQNGYEDIAILSYAAKFASAFYGPFRDAAGCSLGHDKTAHKDRKTYQMNPANSNEALREVAQDIEEGTDMVMVKPGLAYLDIIHQVKAQFALPTFAYHVSGEYAMLKAAAANGQLDHDAALMETMIGFKRAGADGIVTYAAPDLARLIQE